MPYETYNWTSSFSTGEQVLDEIGMTFDPAQQTITISVIPAQLIIHSETIDNSSVQVKYQTTVLPNAHVTVSSPEVLAINLGSRSESKNNLHSSISPREVQNSNFDSGVTVSIQSQDTSPVTKSSGHTFAGTAASGFSKKGLSGKSRAEKTAISASPEYIVKKGSSLKKAKRSLHQNKGKKKP